MKKLAAIIGAWLISICALAANPVPASALVLKIDSGDASRPPLMTIHADNEPLQSILKRLTMMGVTVRIDPSINPSISAHMDQVDVQKGLESILKSLNTAFIWKSVDTPKGKLLSLSELHVVKSGQKNRIQPLNRDDALLIAKNPKDGSLYVKNEILIRFKDDVSFSEFSRILASLGGVVTDVNRAAGVYRIRYSEDVDVLDILEKNSDMKGISKLEPNYAYRASPPVRYSDSTGAASPSVKPEGLKGKARIAILDSGLISDSGLSAYVAASLDAFHPDDPISDRQGHGTQMAMIASGAVSPYGVSSDTGATPVIPIRALDDNGMTSNFIIMQSIDFAIKNGAKVLSLSWGTETKSEFLEQAMDQAASKGLMVVASAGNEPTGNPVYPAAYPSVLGVGALKPDGKIWEQSNYGNFVSVYAPGFASFPVGYNGAPGTYAGTSVSAAYVSHIIADYLSKNPTAAPKDILRELLQKREGK